MIKWKVKYEELEGKNSLHIIMSKKDFLDDEGIRSCAFIFDINDIDKINNMCSLMSSDEINLIQNNNFATLWYNLWLKNAYKKKYLEEMNLSKNKFNHLKIFLKCISQN
jgi:hypothetical protein